MSSGSQSVGTSMFSVTAGSAVVLLLVAAVELPQLLLSDASCSA